MDTENYLDFVPMKRESHPFSVNDKGEVVIQVENRGMFHWIAQKLFGRPRFTQVHLDEMGNFIWPLIDGTKTIYDISVMVREKYGDRAEPLYNRLVQYFETMKSYGFIYYKK